MPAPIKHTSINRFAWLSVAAAVITISLKLLAYILTDSVSLLSDALEAFVNLAGAIMLLAMLTIASRPADEDHAYGHTKAEYFSSGAEGMLILFAALGIIISAVLRLINPQPLDKVGLGLAISTIAALINLGVAQFLLRVSKKKNAISLEANAHHLMTDVWTTVGVLVGIIFVVLTGWLRLDPIIALMVGANIIWTGIRLVRKSAQGLMDTALPEAEQRIVLNSLKKFQTNEVHFHAVRSRQSGMRRFVSFHVLVPGNWSIQDGHQLLETIENEIRQRLGNVTVFTHLEPLEDPTSWEDINLDRPGPIISKRHKNLSKKSNRP